MCPEMSEEQFSIFPLYLIETIEGDYDKLEIIPQIQASIKDITKFNVISNTVYSFMITLVPTLNTIWN